MCELIPLIAIIMSLAIPMVVIIAATQTSINKKNREADIKRLIVENNIDIERAKLLIEEVKPKEQVYTSLRIGALFLGIGIGSLVNQFWVHGDTYILLATVTGFVGLLLLIAFVVETKMRQREKAQANDVE